VISGRWKGGASRDEAEDQGLVVNDEKEGWSCN